MADIDAAQGAAIPLPDARPRERAGSLAGIAWGAAVAGACLLAALVFTWPLPLNLTSTVPLGTEHASTVHLFTIWTLWWTADRAAHAFAGYWDAPSFFPNAGTFTFSEPEPLTGLFVSPLWAVSAPPALIHNVALLAILVLNGVFAYRLCRALEAPRLASLLGGVLAVTLPFSALMLGVVNLIPAFGFLWTLDGLVRFSRSGSAGHAAWTAAGFLATYLTCQQYALMFVPFAAAAGIVALWQRHFEWRSILKLGVAGAVAGVIVLWIALPALTLHEELGFTRSELVVQKLSARPIDFLTRPETASVPFPPTHALEEDTGGLFPGLILSVLAIVGAVVGVRDPRRRRWTVVLLGTALGAMVLAMGYNFGFGALSPFGLLRNVMPGFGELRSVFRFAVIMQAVLPVLAVFALAALPGRFRWAGAWVVAALALVGAAENLSVPQGLVAVPETPRTAWTQWLKGQSDVTALAHVPFPAGLKVQDYEVEAWRMYAQIDHGKPIVNGYSGYFPPGYTDFQLDMGLRFPAADLLCELSKGLGVDTLVVDRPWFARNSGAMKSVEAMLQLRYDDSDVRIYRINTTEEQCKPNSTANNK
jgi:hypothetical protein